MPTTLPNIQLCRDDQPGSILATIECNPIHFGAVRSALGQALRVPARLTDDSRAKNILACGTLSWSGEQEGISVPAQPLVFNHSSLLVPVSDEQIAQIEAKRAGNPAIFELRIQAIGSVDGNSAILIGQQPAVMTLGRDAWLTALGALGWGKRRLIELPAFPIGRDPAWDEVGKRLEAANRRLAAGDPGAALTEARVALERTIEVVGSTLGLSRKGPLKPFGEDMAKELERRHAAGGNDHYQVLAAAIRLATSTFGFSSAGAHGGFDVVERASAELSIGLAAALYVYAARVL